MTVRRQRRISAAPEEVWQVVADPWRLPAFADIPHAGSPVSRGHPVITIIAGGSDPRECRETLQSRAAELDAVFAGATP